MADQIKKLSAGHSIEVLHAIMTEVEEARGEHDNLGERLDEMSSDTPTPSTAAPAMDGTASPGTSEEYARADHVHPRDMSRASAASEAEDRAALIELVDSGAKNFAIPNHVTGEPSSITVVQDDKGHFEISGTTGSSQMTLNLFNQNPAIDLPYGAHISAANVISGISYKARWYNPGGEEKYTTIDSTDLELPANSKLRSLYVQANANTQVSFTINQMVCTKAAWNISQTYQPYRPSYQEIFNWSKATDCLNDDATTNAYFDVQNSYVSVYTNTALQRVVINAHLVTSTAIAAPLSPKAIANIPTTTPLPNIIVRSLTNNVMLSKNNLNRVIAFATTADIASGETLEVQLEYTYF